MSSVERWKRIFPVISPDLETSIKSQENQRYVRQTLNALIIDSIERSEGVKLTIAADNIINHLSTLDDYNLLAKRLVPKFIAGLDRMIDEIKPGLQTILEEATRYSKQALKEEQDALKDMLKNLMKDINV